jgi:RsmE family RNA methyltransferase
VNLILFEPAEVDRPLSLDDPRARHVLGVLRLRPGDSFDAGIVEGLRGKATIDAVDRAVLHLRFEWREHPPPLEPVTLLIGLPRPQTARKVLEEATSLGVSEMHFVVTGRGEAGYASSRLWTTGEWRRHLLAGAQQAFTTRLPTVTWGDSLSNALAGLDPGGMRLALDNYESPSRLGATAVEPPVVIAIGPERGWTAEERTQLREAGFRFVHLGDRVLRVETACVAAITLVRAALAKM